MSNPSDEKKAGGDLSPDQKPCSHGPGGRLLQEGGRRELGALQGCLQEDVLQGDEWFPIFCLHLPSIGITGTVSYTSHMAQNQIGTCLGLYVKGPSFEGSWYSVHVVAENLAHMLFEFSFLLLEPSFNHILAILLLAIASSCKSERTVSQITRFGRPRNWPPEGDQPCIRTHGSLFAEGRQTWPLCLLLCAHPPGSFLTIRDADAVSPMTSDQALEVERLGL